MTKDAQDIAWEDMDKRAQACGKDAAKLVKLAKSLGEVRPCNGGTGIEVLLFDSALVKVLGSAKVWFQTTSDGTFSAEC